MRITTTHPAVATAHVSSDCDPRTKAALIEMMHCVARQHGHNGPIDVNFAIRDGEIPNAFDANYFEPDTEVFDG
ncbi:MAG TPA: hypothetical protein VGO43_06185 [Pyrinomonadaceae bacterium]|jgi:hypothetical protein|nr:hypothetical protein [Pyrinomonadaceae bacterium]